MPRGVGTHCVLQQWVKVKAVKRPHNRPSASGLARLRRLPVPPPPRTSPPRRPSKKATSDREPSPHPVSLHLYQYDAPSTVLRAARRAVGASLTSPKASTSVPRRADRTLLTEPTNSQFTYYFVVLVTTMNGEMSAGSPTSVWVLS